MHNIIPAKRVDELGEQFEEQEHRLFGEDGFQEIVIRIVFGVLLIFAGIMGLTGWADRMKFHGPLAWIAGVISGRLGGFSGTQGGIRAAALFGFDLSKSAFVATSTATGLFVDLSRMSVYLWTP
jgi:hypothetical protein